MSNDREIRVCFVCFRAYPLFNPAVQAAFGGAEVDLYLLATELARDPDFDVRFIVGDYGQPPHEEREGVHLVKSLRVDRNLMMQPGTLWGALRRADADIYMHEASSLATTFVAMYCHVNGRAFVYRTAATYETDGTYFRQNRIRAPFVRWAFGRADVLLTQNDRDAENLSRHFGLSSTVIKNAARPASQVPVEKKTVLWVGRSLPIKRPDLFLKLARELADCPFVMVCSRGTADQHYEQLRQAAKGISNLTFIDYVPFHEIDRYFEQARIFVCTSDAEGFPNTFVQACKAGTAILSLNVNPDGFLDRYRCGVCANGDWQRFADTLRMWLTANEAEQLGQNGIAYIKENHDIGRIIEDYKALFRKAVENRSK